MNILEYYSGGGGHSNQIIAQWRTSVLVALMVPTFELGRFAVEGALHRDWEGPLGSFYPVWLGSGIALTGTAAGVLWAYGGSVICWLCRCLRVIVARRIDEERWMRWVGRYMSRLPIAVGAWSALWVIYSGTRHASAISHIEEWSLGAVATVVGLWLMLSPLRERER